MTMDDERLMAYADGALSLAEAAEVEQAIAGDAGIAAKVAMFKASRVMARQAFGAAPPVPDALAARVAAMAAADAARRAAPAPRGDVIDLAARRRQVPVWQLPIAASIALAVGLFGGWIAKPGADATGGLAVAGLQDPALVTALDTVASGARTDLGGGAAFAAIATFRDGDGQLCREFEHDRTGGATVVAVACRAEADWSVRFAVVAAATDAGGYAPASSLETLDAWLSATGAGAPLSDAEEKTALGALR
jgi:anti-sigma factor RsiW